MVAESVNLSGALVAGGGGHIENSCQRQGGGWSERKGCGEVKVGG